MRYHYTKIKQLFLELMPLLKNLDIDIENISELRPLLEMLDICEPQKVTRKSQIRQGPMYQLDHNKVGLLLKRMLPVLDELGYGFRLDKVTKKCRTLPFQARAAA